MENNELYHHGIKGMRWGVRRYQNKDGSLTAKGRQRYNEESEKLKAKEKELNTRARTKAKIEKLEAKRKELAEREKAMKEAERPEIVKKFLAKRQQKAAAKDAAKAQVKTKDGEKRSIKDLSDDELARVVRRAQLEKQYSDLHPQKVSKGKHFIKSVIDDAVLPGLKAGLKGAVTKASNEAFGKSFTKLMSDDVDKVKKAAEKAKENDGEKPKKEKAKAEKKAEKAKSDEPEYFTGTVSGKGTSKKASAGRDWTNDTVIDADWWDASPSQAPSSSVRLGQSYVAGLLPERTR